MLKHTIPFPDSKGVHPSNLDKEIATAMGWKRHAGVEDKGCFCGINVISEGGHKVIQIVWTDDGETGYVKKLSIQEEVALSNVLNAHKGGHNGQVR